MAFRPLISMSTYFHTFSALLGTN